jgi:hypothetical protein
VSGLRPCSSILWATSIGFFTPTNERFATNIHILLGVKTIEINLDGITRQCADAPEITRSSIHDGSITFDLAVSSQIRTVSYQCSKLSCRAAVCLWALTSIQAFLILEDRYCFLHSTHSGYLFSSKFQGSGTSTGSAAVIV